MIHIVATITLTPTLYSQVISSYKNCLLFEIHIHCSDRIWNLQQLKLHVYRVVSRKMAEGISEKITWPTECPFAELGCTIQLCNCQDYNHHLALNIEQHLQLVMDLHKESEVISPLQKLYTIRSEIEYLEGTLESLGVRELPALECIKTQMKQPSVGISSLGDKVAFRMPEFIKLKESSQKWCSPLLTLRGKYQLRLIVCPTGTGAGYGTHLSVTLVSPLVGEGFEWPIVLPRHLGVKVELLVETDGSVSVNGDSSESESSYTMGEPCTHTFTWRPRVHKTSSSKRFPNSQPREKDKQTDAREIQRRVSKILPPWCQPPPTVETAEPNPPNPFKPLVSNEPYVTTYPQKKKLRREGLNEDMKLDKDGVTLFSDEKFATQEEIEEIIREFNSLVFQISICLMPTHKTDN